MLIEGGRSYLMYVEIMRVEIITKFAFLSDETIPMTCRLSSSTPCLVVSHCDDTDLLAISSINVGHAVPC